MSDWQAGATPGSRESAARGAILPAEEVFLNDAAPPSADTGPAAAQSAKRPRPPGPGLLESIAWMIGVHFAQIVAAAVAAAVLVAAYLATARIDDLEKSLATPSGISALTKSLEVFFAGNLIYLIAAAQLGTVVFGLVAIRLRFGRKGWSRLGWQLPVAGHWFLVVLLVPPLWLLCSELQKEMFCIFPSAHEELTQLMEAMTQASLPALLLVIGAGPALGEELVFRGLIGRGMLARWGFVRGIAITSFLFGVMHINPAQAIGVIPLGFAMHFLYFTTRSFWAPVTLHLANNSLSVILLKHENNLPVAMLIDDHATPPVYLFIVAAAMITAIGLLLWETRVRYRLADGSAWSPGYDTLEVPPLESGAFAVRQNPRLLLIAGSTINSLGFLAVLWRLAVAG